jgi:ACR3 family arsenite transporter
MTTHPDTPRRGEPEPAEAPIVVHLSAMDRMLPLWIGLAMVLGLVLGRLVPGLDDALNAVKLGQTSLLIALGLLLMMYPVLAKVRYDEIGLITADRRMIVASLTMNWVVGPLVMFTLAWLLLADQPAYRTGVILVGLARCIAMVLLWNDLACGDREMAAVLVALNAVFQVVAYAALGYFYLAVLPGWLGLEQSTLDVSMLGIAKIVAIFLGIPLVAGYLTRTRRDGSGTSPRSCPGSARSPCGGCSSPLSSCSRCRATPSPPNR